MTYNTKLLIELQFISNFLDWKGFQLAQKIGYKPCLISYALYSYL